MVFRNLSGAIIFAIVAAVAGARVEGVELSKEEQTDIGRGTQGSFVPIPELARGRQQLPIISVTTSALRDAQLLFSDLPEYLGQSNGVAMMEDLTAGNYRLYVYHVPGSKDLLKTVSVVVQNLGKKRLHVRFVHYAFPRPGVDYAAMGVAGLMEFFTGHVLPPSLSIAPGARKVLDWNLDKTAAADPQLVHALYEFRINQPARIAVLQRDTNQASTAVLDLLPKLPRQLPGEKSSGAGRGIFRTADIAVTNRDGLCIDSADGVQRLVLADGRHEPWVTGFDALAGNMAVTNKGSYGVIYHVRLAYRSSDGRAMAVLVGAPGRRSSGETRPMAALKVSDGIWKGGWLAIAASRAASRERGTMALAQKLAPPRAGKINYVEMIYSPPGGSSLPTPIFFAPFRP
jgi:hypothetical protein